MLGPGAFDMRASPQTWQVKRQQGRKRAMVLVDVRLLWLLGALAACGLLYAGWVNIVGVSPSAPLTADQVWRQQTIAPVDWTYDDVGAWARGLGLRLLERGLRKNGVDGQLLLTLTAHDLRKDLGISNDLQVRKFEQALEKLRSGDQLPPSASGQGLLLKGLNTSEPATHGSAFALAGAGKFLGSQNPPPPATLELYRIWHKMSSDSPFLKVHVDPTKDWDYLINGIRAHIIHLEGVHAGHAEQRGNDGLNGDVRITLKKRNGVSIQDVSHLSADSNRLFLLVGHEVFFFPDDNIGEKMMVPLPSSHRSVEVEVLASTPRLMLIRNFLSPSECEEIKKTATPKLEPSTVLAQGDQSKGENKVKDAVRTSETAWLMNKNEPIVATVRNRVAELVQLPMNFAEDMQVLKYGFKQHYHVHYDFFDPKMYPGDKRWASGHNRLATVFFYLTSVQEGGHTVFPYANTPVEDHHKIHAYGPCEEAAKTSLKVPAEQGHAIIFYHMNPQGHLKGELDKTALHGGCDPIIGEKWAANYWIRNGPVL